MIPCEVVAALAAEPRARPTPVAVPREPTPWERELGGLRPDGALDRVDVVLDFVRGRLEASRDDTPDRPT